MSKKERKIDEIYRKIYGRYSFKAIDKLPLTDLITILDMLEDIELYKADIKTLKEEFCMTDNGVRLEELTEKVDILTSTVDSICGMIKNIEELIYRLRDDMNV